MRSLVTILVAAAVLLPLAANATDVRDSVWGVWNKAGSPYYVVGDIWVPVDSTLIIMPGVEVIFYGDFKFEVLRDAILEGDGAVGDSIIFTTPFHENGWQGIRFLAANNASLLSYCRIEYGRADGGGDLSSGGGIFINSCSPTISHSHIDSCFAEGNGGAIYCDFSNATISGNTITRNSGGYGGGISCSGHSNPIISSNTISNNSAAGYGGGIHCYESSPIISSNTISNNSIPASSYQAYGGGISCSGQSNPTISGNTISDNLAAGLYAHGGGIFCSESSPTVSSNTISNNSITASGYYAWGGGIYCSGQSNPTISGNTISGNSVTVGRASYGGGIYWRDESNPRISNNTISDNSAQNGGGLSCESSDDDTVTYNTVNQNSATLNGGGIYLNASNPSIINNTFADNRAGSKGGGLYCYASSPTVKNSIFWSDSAATGLEIYLEGGSGPYVTYCDVDSGWPGQGNIDCDPEFVNPDSGNYHLQITSCCRNAGDPDPHYNDPDGTRNDIGALYFPEPPHPYISLVPHNTPIVIPYNGGDLYYDAWIYNLTDTTIWVDAWSYAFVPGMGHYGPLVRYDSVRVGRNRQLGRNDIREHVPGPAPEGEYSYVGYIGDFGVDIIDSSYFRFTKLGSAKGSVAGWRTFKGWFGGDELSFAREPIIPTDFALRQNYPNPFNAKTTINYQLPATSDVKLEVYNLLGRRVATLVDETPEAGYRSVIWDASEVSSGLYFYKLTAGDFTQTRRMMLVK